MLSVVLCHILSSILSLDRWVGMCVCVCGGGAYNNSLLPADPLSSKSSHQFASTVQFHLHLIWFLPQTLLHGQLFTVLLFQLLQFSPQLLTNTCRSIIIMERHYALLQTELSSIKRLYLSGGSMMYWFFIPLVVCFEPRPARPASLLAGPWQHSAGHALVLLPCRHDRTPGKTI